MAKERRTYEDACGMAHALDLLGERWALIVLRELMLGPKRFSELRADIPGISANVLTQRLEGLEETGLLVRRKLAPPSNAQVYELTPWGYEVEPIGQALGRWATRSPLHDPTAPISAVSVLLSFRTMLDAARAEGIDARIGFRFGAYAYLGHLTPHAFPIRRDDVADADLIFTGDPRALAGAVYGGVPLAALEEAGALAISGDRALAERFLTLFPLPPKVG
jgi:DNA-binding HxlR family transcriptional regulator